jgi:hypothetical protein
VPQEKEYTQKSYFEDGKFLLLYLFHGQLKKYSKASIPGVTLLDWTQKFSKGGFSAHYQHSFVALPRFNNIPVPAVT